MAFNGMRLEYSSEGSLDFIYYKDRMEVVLYENGFLDYIKIYITKPGSIDAHNLAQRNKYVAKERRIILEGVRDHIVSNIHGKETPISMWTTVTNILKNNSDHRKLALKYKLRNIKMQKNDTILQYLSRFTQVWDENGGFGVNVVEYQVNYT